MLSIIQETWDNIRKYWRTGLVFLLVMFFLGLFVSVIPVNYGPTLDYLRDTIGYKGFFKRRTAISFFLLFCFLVTFIVFMSTGADKNPVHTILDNSKHAGKAMKRRLFQFIQSISAPEAAAIITIIAVGTALRLYYGMHRMPEHDELHTFYRHVSRNWYGMITYYGSNNNHWFHTVAAWFSTRLFGEGVLTLRLPATLAGILSVPMMWLLMRRIVSPVAGVTAALLLAVCEYHLYYSSNARGYTMQIFFMLLSAWIAVDILHGIRFMALRWTAFVIVSALGLYTLPTALPGFAGICLWLTANLFFAKGIEHRTSKFWQLMVAGMLTGILTLLAYSPIIGLYGLDPIANNQFTRAMPHQEFFNRIGDHMMRLFSRWFSEYPQPLEYGFFGMILIGLFAAFWREKSVLPLGLCIVVTTVALFLKHPTLPFGRVLLFMLVLLIAYIAVAVDLFAFIIMKLWSKGPIVASWGAASIGALLAIGLAIRLYSGPYVERIDETGTFPGAREVLTDLQSQLQPDDVIVANNVADYTTRFMLSLRGVENEMHKVPTKKEFLYPGRIVWFVMYHRYNPKMNDVVNAREMDRSRLSLVGKYGEGDSYLYRYEVPDKP